MSEVAVLIIIGILIVVLVVSTIGLYRSMEIEEASWVMGGRAFLTCFIIALLIFAGFVLRDVLSRT